MIDAPSRHDGRVRADGAPSRHAERSRAEIGAVEASPNAPEKRDRERPSREILAWLAASVGRRGVGYVALLSVMQAGSAGLSVALAPVMQRAVDAAVGGQAPAFWAWAAAFALVIALQVALRAIIRRTLEAARSIIENRLRSRVFSDVLGLSTREAEARHSADLMSRMTSDVVVVSDVASFLPGVVSMVIRLVGVLVVMALIAPGLALAFACVGAVALVVSAGLRRVLRRRHRAMQEAEGRMRAFVQECLESLLVIRVFGAGPKMLAGAEGRMDEHRAARMRKNTVSNFGSTGFSVAVQGGYVLGFVWCGVGLLNGTLTYGSLVAVIQLIGQIAGPLGGLGGTHARWSSMLASAERLMEVADEKEAPAKTGAFGAASGQVSDRAGEGAAESAGAAGVGAAGEAEGCPPADRGRFYEELSELRLVDVGFSYDKDKPALKNFSARFAKGAATAVVGPSGAGKSTLMKLVLAAYEPDEGRVELVGESAGEGGSAAGRPWACSPEAAPAGLFAYVPQGNRLMAGTVANAVALAGEGEPDAALLAEALHAACAEEFVAELPGGVEAVLGERGAGLSEGQTQRLAVARAVYSGAPVLLLDEATSALDVQTEREMLGRLRDLPGRTVVIVTHRAEAAGACDAVVRVGEKMAS